MAGGWRGNVDSVDIGIIDEFLSVGIPFTDVVVFCIAACFLFAATHDCHDARACNLAEGWATLLFGHLAATDKSPSYFFHICDWSLVMFHPRDVYWCKGRFWMLPYSLPLVEGNS